MNILNRIFDENLYLFSYSFNFFSLVFSIDLIFKNNLDITLTSNVKLLLLVVVVVCFFSSIICIYRIISFIDLSKIRFLLLAIYLLLTWKSIFFCLIYIIYRLIQLLCMDYLYFEYHILIIKVFHLIWLNNNYRRRRIKMIHDLKSKVDLIQRRFLICFVSI